MSFKSGYWLSAGMFTLLQRVITTLLGIGSFAILVRMLNKTEFGVWALFISFTGLLEVARIGFVQNALIKFLAASLNEDDYSETITSSVILNGGLVLLSLIICIVSAYPLGVLWKAPDLQPMLYAYCLTTVSVAFLQHTNFIQQAKLNFKAIFVSTMLRQLTFFLIVLYFYLNGKSISLISLVHSMTIAAIIGGISGVIGAGKYFSFKRISDFKRTLELFHYGKFVFGTNISSMLYSSMEQMLLGLLLPAASVAVYNTAGRFNNLIDAPVAAVASVVFPQSAKRAVEGGAEAVRYLYERSVGVLLAILLPLVLGIILLSKYLVLILAGKAYLEAVPYVIVFSLAAFFQPFIRQFGVVMDSIGKPQINFRLLVIITALNLIIGYSAIRLLGLPGAAVSSFSLALLFAVIAQILLKKEIGYRFYAPYLFAVQFYKQLFTTVQNKFTSPKAVK